MITVQDILSTELYKDSEVLAGSNGLLREVSTITISEVPDSANWLRGGELVCTTAFFVSNQVTHQREWIESIIQNGAAALVIKASRFLGVVPNAIIEVANEHNFPIISLAHEVTWPIVIEAFMDFFMNERIKLMKLVEETQSNLTNLVLENASLEVIVNKISQLVGNPIILEDASLQITSIGLPEEVSMDMSDILGKRKSDMFYNKILKSSFYKDIRKGAIGEQLETTVTSDGEDKTVNIMLPIYSGKNIYGFVSMLECKKAHSLVDRIVLKNSTTALALSLMQQYVNKQTFRKKNLALIEDIINGRMQTQIIYDETFLDINWANPMVAVMMQFIELNESSNRLNNHSEELIYRTVQTHLNKKFGQVIIGNVGPLFTILISFSAKRVEEFPTLLKEEMEKLKIELEKQFGKEKVLIGVGGAYSDLKLVNKSYKEANNALLVVKKFIWKGTMLFFDDVGIYRIFSMIHDRADIEEFCDSFLAELKKYDHENGNVLLETLHVYLLCDCSIKATAQKLFLHPNTVSYRIKKVKGIIDNDLDSPEFKMAYLFALESDVLLNY